MIEGYVENVYLRAIAIFLIVFVVLRVFLYVIGKILPFLVSKTKTTLDDIIIKKTSGPLTIIAILVGIRFSISEINLGGSSSGIVEGILLTLMIFMGGILVYHILNALITVGFSEFVKKNKGKVNESLLQFFHSILIIAIFIVIFLSILASWGIEIGPLLAGLGVAGLAIAFALQSTLANVFGGISIILDRSIQLGDVIKLEDGTSGEVLKINLRSTKIKTFDNELIIIPNSKLSEGNIQNIALPKPDIRVAVPFGVAYGSDVAEVKKIVMKEIKKVKGFIDDPEPAVRFLAMADSSLNFSAYFYIDSYKERIAALDEANTRIYNALNEAGIQIPFPQMDVWLKKK